ncbi:MAG TPA: CoA-transferase [Steroidobacteraceae bacterium]
MMIVAAARALAGARTVFVGVGLPNIACNLARRTVAADLELIYEAGVYGARPARLPLSIGDPTLVSGATSAVSQADLFGLYLQGGRVEVALLGGAQIDRHGNLNSTVIGPYDRPRTRLPGAGGATEIAAHAGQVFIVMKATPRSFVPKLDFQTSGGHFPGRARSGAKGGGPSMVVTDVGILGPRGADGELALAATYPGVTVEEARTAVGWPLAVAPELDAIAPPTSTELEALRALQLRTETAHREPVRLPT